MRRIFISRLASPVVRIDELTVLVEVKRLSLTWVISFTFGLGHVWNGRFGTDDET